MKYNSLFQRRMICSAVLSALVSVYSGTASGADIEQSAGTNSTSISEPDKSIKFKGNETNAATGVIEAGQLEVTGALTNSGGISVTGNAAGDGSALITGGQLKNSVPEAEITVFGGASVSGQIDNYGIIKIDGDVTSKGVVNHCKDGASGELPGVIEITGHLESAGKVTNYGQISAGSAHVTGDIESGQNGRVNSVISVDGELEVTGTVTNAGTVKAGYLTAKNINTASATSNISVVNDLTVTSTTNDLTLKGNVTVGGVLDYGGNGKTLRNDGTLSAGTLDSKNAIVVNNAGKTLTVTDGIEAKSLTNNGEIEAGGVVSASEIANGTGA